MAASKVRLWRDANNYVTLENIVTAVPVEWNKPGVREVDRLGQVHRVVPADPLQLQRFPNFLNLTLDSTDFESVTAAGAKLRSFILDNSINTDTQLVLYIQRDSHFAPPATGYPSFTVLAAHTISDFSLFHIAGDHTNLFPAQTEIHVLGSANPDNDGIHRTGLATQYDAGLGKTLIEVNDILVTAGTAGGTLSLTGNYSQQDCYQVYLEEVPDWLFGSRGGTSVPDSIDLRFWVESTGFSDDIPPKGFTDFDSFTGSANYKARST